MPMQGHSHLAGPRLKGSPAILAALIALAIGAAAPPAAATTSSAGQLYGFGSNSAGELGSTTNNGTSKPNPTPTLISLPGASGPVSEVAVGGGHSLVLTSSGQLYAFGSNIFGQLGNTTNEGTYNPNPTPTPISLPGASGPVSEIAAGELHSLALTFTGQLYAFGSNQYGQLGVASNQGTEEPNPTPTLVSLPGASGPVSKIAAGGAHSLALTSTGQLYAFGTNYSGQLGNTTNLGTGKPNSTPTLVSLPGASGPVREIAAGYNHSLALTSSGQLYTFGANSAGQLGNTILGTEVPNPTPTLISLPGASGPVSKIAAGGSHSLALTSSGELYGFGNNQSGELGITTNAGTSKPNPMPTLISLPGASGELSEIAAGATHSLALSSTGELYAFGDNAEGQLGSATNSGLFKPNPTPTPVELPTGTTIDTVAPGATAYHTLAVIADLSVTTSSLPSGRVGAPYGAAATAQGGGPPYAWQASGLPGGLSIDASSGELSGTPKKAGATQVTLSVSDRFGIVAKGAPITLRIESKPARPAISELRQSHRRWREGRRLAQASSAEGQDEKKRAPLGTTFTFKLNRKAKVRFAFVQRKGGPKHRRSAGASFSFSGHPGKNRVAFQGRISPHQRLAPGHYRLTATASAGGARSKPRSLNFTILP